MPTRYASGSLHCRIGHVSALRHDYQEVITHCTQHRPPGCPPLHAPQPLIPVRVPLSDPSEIRRWREHAQPAKVREREVPLECAIELARAVVARPDRVLVHADWHEVAGITDFQPRPLALPQAV